MKGRMKAGKGESTLDIDVLIYNTNRHRPTVTLTARESYLVKRRNRFLSRQVRCKFRSTCLVEAMESIRRCRRRAGAQAFAKDTSNPRLY